MHKDKVSSLKLFLLFLRIGAFTIGGGYAMLPLIQADIKKRHWIIEEELMDLISIALATPGVLAVNIAILLGYRIRKFKGALSACLGAVLPSFVIILLIAVLFSSYRDNELVMSIFQGIRPVVVALILVPMIKMSKISNTNWWSWVLSLIVLLLVCLLSVSPIYILLTIIVISFFISWFRKRKYLKK